MITKINKRILYQLLDDEFIKFGDKFEKIARNDTNGMYCYKRTTSDGLTYYEVFKAPKAKDETGIFITTIPVLRNLVSARLYVSGATRKAPPTKSPSIWAGNSALGDTADCEIVKQ